MKQIARWVPRGIVKEAAESHGIRYRTFDPWSHLVTLLVVQLSGEASHHDSVRAPDCTLSLAKGDILVADRAYLDLKFLCALVLRGVFFTVRQKTNLLLDTYGTAGGWVFRRKSARPAWIQALLPIANAPNGTP